MHEHDPRRLKETAGTPDVLSQALSALRNGPDDAARLARVSKQLGAILDAVPPPATPVRALRPGLPVLKLVAGGALLVAPLLWLAYARFGAQEAQPSVELPPPPTAAAPADLPPTAAPAELSPAPSAPQLQPARGELDNARPHRQLAAHAKPNRRAASGERRAGKPSESSSARSSEPGQGQGQGEEQSQALASQGDETTRPVQPAAQEPAPAPAPPKPKRQPTSADEQKLASRTPSESELLFDARKALPGDAQLALRLLTQHAARYPEGQLVPEREVLAIEALRKLGRTQEADARLQRFQAKYPNSLHLQRLQH